MWFGPVPVAEADGALLAHTVKADGLTLKKGTRLDAAQCAVLAAAGLESLTVVRLEPGDVPEDEAALRVARACAGIGLVPGPAGTGRVNLHAEAAGLLLVEAARIDRLNLLDESVTLATLPPFAPVQPGDLVATVKIIPYAAPEAAVAAVEALAAEGVAPLALAGFRSLGAALIQTRLPGLKESVLDKTSVVTRERIAAIGGHIDREIRCPHDTGALTDALRALNGGPLDLLLIAGASAICDRRDVLPAAIEAAGGTVVHLGMPVDPGNLLLLGRFGERPVLGLPGCARSPKLNGFDWVLQRLAAGLPVGRAEIMRMGVGGLLADIPTRPQPRDPAAAAGRPGPGEPRRVAAVVLAAGQSRRMGAVNKLVAEIDGKPMIRHTLEAVLGSAAKPVVVVAGDDAEGLAEALAGLPVRIVHNPDYAAGLSTSLRVGLQALPAEADGALVCLGDMPQVGTVVLDRLIAAFDRAASPAICIPVHDGRRGNPVVWDHRFFQDLMALEGDAGGRQILGNFATAVTEVAVETAAVLTDVDTPEDLAAVRERRFRTSAG